MSHGYYCVGVWTCIFKHLYRAPARQSSFRFGIARRESKIIYWNSPCKLCLLRPLLRSQDFQFIMQFTPLFKSYLFKRFPREFIYRKFRFVSCICDDCLYFVRCKLNILFSALCTRPVKGALYLALFIWSIFPLVWMIFKISIYKSNEYYAQKLICIPAAH